MRALALVAIFLTFFLISAGCTSSEERKSFLGLRTVEQCDTDTELDRDAEQMQCYHTAAVSKAYLCGSRPAGHYSPCDEAESICEAIYVNWGGTDQSKDMRHKADLITNHCFYDVAKITRNVNTCGFINKRVSTGTQLTGDYATKDMCEDEVDRLAQITPENYYTQNPNNICTIVYVLPFLLVLAIARQGP